MRRVIVIAICSVALSACGSMVTKDETAQLLQQMQVQQNREMAALREQMGQSQALTAEQVAEIVQAQLAAQTPTVDEADTDIKAGAATLEDETSEENGDAGILLAEADVAEATNKILPVNLTTNDGFAAAERAENCVVRLMTAGSEVDRPTTAKMAAYVCSHMYGLNFNRKVKALEVQHVLDKDGKQFEAVLERDNAAFNYGLQLDGADDGITLDGEFVLANGAAKE
jgi:hypothetical protein